MDKNKNSLFILPIYRRSIGFYGKHFDNIYLDQREPDKIKFVFKNEPKDEVKQHIINRDEFISAEKEEGYLIFTLKLPKEFITDIRKYRYGKYSELSKPLKNIILTLNPDISDLGKILFPKDKDRIALGKSLGAELPKNSEIYDIIGTDEYYSNQAPRTELGKNSRNRTQKGIHKKN